MNAPAPPSAMSMHCCWSERRWSAILSRLSAPLPQSAADQRPAAPLFLPILIAGSTATMLAMRMTYFPEALVRALGKIRGKGKFDGSRRLEALLFEGLSDHKGGTHQSVADRIAAITAFGRALMTLGRLRKDTPGPASVRPRFGARPTSAQGARPHAWTAHSRGPGHRALLVFHWPANNDPAGVLDTFAPGKAGAGLRNGQAGLAVLRRPVLS
jgi:hypothetical protein